MASAVLRALTLDNLSSLTHTCCYRSYGEFDTRKTRPTPEDIEAIHNTERADIELLNISTDEFEMNWSNYNKSFYTFIRRVWKPRMREVRRQRQVYMHTYEAELLRMGVILKHPADGHVWASESESDWIEEEDDERETDADGWYTTDEEEADERESEVEDLEEAGTEE
ncbi:hypothetical protein CC86DRAFT_415423 [Ophiobolus disseminans]|uniref:Uncharacterized protein n=1 Tax=Ophiobolus disseminans TaxID=1469910 RepID=A0A6A7AJU6_9PLEO|nr:hypothetical protein CC86DRAFT_415423 [Ophiobolus disseminans]